MYFDFTISDTLETGGRQYKDQKNDIIYVEKLEKNDGELAKFDNVLMVYGKFGAP